jgi:GTP 3',8-cyclase
MLSDKFGRKFNYLRLSLTDVCNFRCHYCLPQGYKGDRSSRNSFLTLTEIEHLMAGLNELGVKKVRLTGGEPTLRRDFIDILALIANRNGIDTIALTTNGYSLSQNAKRYQAAGLTNITVSLDSLTSSRFQAITQMANFHKVLEGIETCLSLSYQKVKINAVLLRDMNDTAEEINKFLEYVAHKSVTIRFIELMKTADNQELFDKHFVSTKALVEKLLNEGWQRVSKSITDGPAVEFSHPDYMGKIGVIAPYSAIFCQDCNRVRISAKGELYVCLFHKSNVPLRDLLVDSSQKEALIQRITKAYGEKKVSHFLHEGEMGRNNHFSSIGG